MEHPKGYNVSQSTATKEATKRHQNKLVGLSPEAEQALDDMVRAYREITGIAPSKSAIVSQAMISLRNQKIGGAK